MASYSHGMSSDADEKFLARIRELASGQGERSRRAKQIADAIRAFGDYRWVGVYEVSPEFASIIAWSGPGEPAYPTFPVTMGLTSSAIQQRSTVVVNDVTTDPRYLTAFGNTHSEIIVPVIDPRHGRVIGTIDVDSELVNRFRHQDQSLLERCVQAGLPLWQDSKS